MEYHLWWPQGLPHGTPRRRINGTNHLLYFFRHIPIHPPPNGDLPFRRQLRESLLPDLRRPTYCQLRGRYVRVHCNIPRNASPDKGDCRKSRQVQRFYQRQEDNRSICFKRKWLRRIATEQKGYGPSQGLTSARTTRLTFDHLMASANKSASSATKLQQH